MKTKIILFSTIISIVLILSGCYTQLGTVRDTKSDYQEEEYSYNNQDYDSDTLYDREGNTIINNYYFDGYWYPRYRWMFSYYYPSYYWPSYSFYIAYRDPWLYDWYWDRYWYYDPLYWCYTPMVSYPIYYPPYYWNYPWYYVSRDGDVKSTRRDFGNQRGPAQTDRSPFDRNDDRFGTGRSGYDIPNAIGITGGGRSQNPTTEQMRGKSRSDESSRSVTPRTGERSVSGRGDSQRPPSRRERYEQPGRGDESNRTSGSERGRRSENREGTRIYTPPPAPAPQPSSPPPSSSPAPSRGGDSRGGSSNDNGNSRGGNTRGGR